jgi:hypothetical protein
VDRHRFDADPDPNFYVDADPDPDWHQNDGGPHADPTPGLLMFENQNIFCIFIFSHSIAS